MNKIKGYKVFKPDWTCRGYKFKVGNTYGEDVVPKCCSTGFHFCLNLIDCFNYYDFNSKNKVAEVLAIGDIDKNDEDTKCCTNRIKIIREMSWEEVLKLCNTGNHNTGKGNTGDCNTGNRNTGNNNSGYGNTGNWNTGSRNTGDFNTGSLNTGDYNTRNRNTGNMNTGDRNTGNMNTGNRNTGIMNTGNRNTGSMNTGNYNTGLGNTGNMNTGNMNTGIGNTGDWNTGNYNTGNFNTLNQKIMLFNKTSNMTREDWIHSEARYILSNINERVTTWISKEYMTKKEKKENPSYKTTGGYLKVLDAVKCRQKWWDLLSEKDKNIVKSIPNFDADIFYECTGINVNMKL